MLSIAEKVCYDHGEKETLYLMVWFSSFGVMVFILIPILKRLQQYMKKKSANRWIMHHIIPTIITK
jgi:hypothetical protein